MLWTRLLYDTTFIYRKNDIAFFYHPYENTTQQIYVHIMTLSIFPETIVFSTHLNQRQMIFVWNIQWIKHIFFPVYSQCVPPTQRFSSIFFFHPLSGIYQANIFSVVWQKCRNKSFGWYLCRNTNSNSFLMIYSCCSRKVCTKTEKNRNQERFLLIISNEEFLWRWNAIWFR